MSALSVVRWIRRVADSELEPSSRLALVMLASYASATGECWPSLPTLAKSTGLSRRTLQAHIKAVEAAGWLTSTAAWCESGRQTSTRYQLLGPEFGAGEGAAIAPLGVQPLHGEGAAVARGRVQPLHGEGATAAPLGVQPLHPLNYSGERDQRNGARPRAADLAAHGGEASFSLPGSAIWESEERGSQRGSGAGDLGWIEDPAMGDGEKGEAVLRLIGQLAEARSAKLDGNGGWTR